MFGRDAGKPELFDIEESSLTYVKEQGVCAERCRTLARALPLPPKHLFDRSLPGLIFGSE
jgi:hypothetical protein